MRMLLFYILFLAFGCQQTTDNGQQTLSTVVGNEDARPCVSTGDYHCDSSTSNNAYPMTVDCCPLSVDYYKSQIRLADSLYKNYLPQYNFDEVKKAVAFFDSLRLTTDNSQQTTDLIHSKKSQQLSNSASQQLSNSTSQQLSNSVSQPLSNSVSQQLSLSASQQLSNSVSCAKAHYYHAVGLTERDDIVGACEHYLRALEIMEPLVEASLPWRLTTNDKSLKSKEKSSTAKSQKPKVKKNKTVDRCPLSVDNPEDYKKIRFLALIYNRLGRLFYNENYCDLAIVKYRKALKYFEILDDNNSKANVLKELGNSYQLANRPDSALYYYNESLKYNSSLPNKLDVEKSIAQILFYKGERDSAYRLLKSNLNNLVDCSSKYSYYYTLGDMYFNDMLYDSAIYYLEKSYVCDNYSIKAASSTKLSAIYESLGNFEMKALYDSDIVKLSIGNANNDVKSAKLQNVYDNYTKRKLDREKVIEKKWVHDIVVSLISIMILMLILMLIIRKIYRTRHNELLYSLNEKEKDIANKNIIIDNFTEEIISEKSKNNSYQKIIEDNNNDIIFLENELNKLREQLSYTKQIDVNSYYETEICKNIMYQIAYKNNNKVKSTKLKALKAKDIISLKYAANAHLNNILERISSKYPKIDNEDLVCICLLLLDINITDMSELLDKSYNAVWRRIGKIKAIFNLNTDSNLQSFLLSII